MDDLYAEAWQRLALDREQCADIERECTPVLAFGRWQSSRVATVGLNPSENEFRGEDGQPLSGARQRFLHWPEDGLLTQERLVLARHRAEGYFELGNVYATWFGDYTRFLEGLDVSFGGGTACHTDYLSPFATRIGIGALRSTTSRRLAEFGYGCWLQVLRQMPRLELLVGHGRGWWEVPRLLKLSDWTGIATPYDAKGGRTKIARPFLLFARGVLPQDGRPLAVYWWRPNPDGAPLAWLTGGEKAALGALVRDHASRQGLLS
jgi:hypothetical protein